MSDCTAHGPLETCNACIHEKDYGRTQGPSKRDSVAQDSGASAADESPRFYMTAGGVIWDMEDNNWAACCANEVLATHLCVKMNVIAPGPLGDIHTGPMTAAAAESRLNELMADGWGHIEAIAQMVNESATRANHAQENPSDAGPKVNKPNTPTTPDSPNGKDAE